MTDGYHPPVEEYLETIQSLTEEGTPVIQARIAERLGRSAPSVSEMLERLTADGYVVRSGRVFELTGQGRTLADSVIRKHRLAERLLVDVIGLPWHKAHMEAGRWEHVISDEVERRLVELLGNPTTCPHGNPIPGSGAGDPPAGQVSLADVEPGRRVRLERITEEVELDMASLEYLDNHGAIPGREALVQGRKPDGTTTLEIDGRPVDLTPAICQQLFVAAS
ncbi:MAG TPA: metal-dependent transcriptional regulator [Acidimicrobiaceae bacterium]|nr:metal-dependent transcriptional regulator [Acidimicrobiaceae bacterium]